MESRINEDLASGNKKRGRRKYIRRVLLITGGLSMFIFTYVFPLFPFLTFEYVISPLFSLSWRHENFDRDKWLAMVGAEQEGETRLQMIDSLLEQYLPHGRPLADVLWLLGEPDGPAGWKPEWREGARERGIYYWQMGPAQNIFDEPMHLRIKFHKDDHICGVKLLEVDAGMTLAAARAYSNRVAGVDHMLELALSLDFEHPFRPVAIFIDEEFCGSGTLVKEDDSRAYIVSVRHIFDRVSDDGANITYKQIRPYSSSFGNIESIHPVGKDDTDLAVCIIGHREKVTVDLPVTDIPGLICGSNEPSKFSPLVDGVETSIFAADAPTSAGLAFTNHGGMLGMSGTGYVDRNQNLFVLSRGKSNLGPADVKWAQEGAGELCPDYKGEEMFLFGYVLSLEDLRAEAAPFF